MKIVGSIAAAAEGKPRSPARAWLLILWDDLELGIERSFAVLNVDFRLDLHYF